MHSILRIEHKDTNQGPYREESNSSIKAITNSHLGGQEQYPCPWDDIGIQRSPSPNEFCGFKDVKQLRKWFSSEELAVFKKEGYLVKRLSLDDVLVTEIGECQVLFTYN